MPVNRKVKKAMEKQYGKKKGERVYYAWENKRSRAKKRNKKRR